MNKTEAMAQADQIRELGMFDNEMLVTSVETFYYTHSISVGLIFTYNFFKSNTGYIESTKQVEIVLPNQYDFQFIIPTLKLILLILFFVVMLIYAVRFGIVMKKKLATLCRSCQLGQSRIRCTGCSDITHLIYPSDIMSVF